MVTFLMCKVTGSHFKKKPVILRRNQVILTRNQVILTRNRIILARNRVIITRNRVILTRNRVILTKKLIIGIKLKIRIMSSVTSVKYNIIYKRCLIVIFKKSCLKRLKLSDQCARKCTQIQGPNQSTQYCIISIIS